MDKLYIEQTEITPTVELDNEKGTITLKGISIPEDSLEFYDPIFNWIDEYGKKPNSSTLAVFCFEYFNTSSAKCILDILRQVTELKESGNDVSIKWYYEEEDESVQQVGVVYRDLLKAPMELIEIKNE